MFIDILYEAIAQVWFVLVRGFFGGNILHFLIPSVFLGALILYAAPKSRMMGAFFKNARWAVWAWGGGLTVLYLVYVQVQFSVVINDWYGNFYNLFQEPKKHTVQEFWVSLRMFLWITIPWVVVWSLTKYLTSIYTLRWREAITVNYLPLWCPVGVDIEGASQRIQEDTQKFSDILETLGLAFMRTLMTLIVFLPVLWQLSENIDVPLFIPGTPEMRIVNGVEVTINHIPGVLVWLAVITSVGGTILSFLVGIKLPGLEYNNQKVEAAFRKQLVLGEDNKVTYAVLPALFELFTGIRTNYQSLYLHYGYFNVWIAAYGQLMSVVADAFAGPGIFTGAITLGVLVQVNNAFGKVHSGFSFFAESWTTVTKFLSVLKRLNEFERNLGTQTSTPTTVR
ncbi:MAG TPA: putative transporter [Candidatus Paceibacterota bacterium]